jgi:acetyl-CoA carboxylase biotin carboxylase subunit
VPQYYDSLIAKLICHGKDREETMNKTQRALGQFVVQGIHTSIPLHQKIFADAEFRAGKFDTKFMERFFEREGHKKDAAVEDHFSPLQPIRVGGKIHG